MRPFSPASERLQGSVYSRFAARLATHQGPVYPLHIGDTWMEPAVGCRSQDQRVADHPGLHRYSTVRGRASLVQGICGEVERLSGASTGPDNVLVSAGGTGGLAAVVGAIVRPGAKVVVLAPHWPLIAGMVTAFGATPVIVPFFGKADDPASAAAILESAIDADTVAVYWNTPSNPAGLNVPASWLQALVAVARSHDLWILADEVYEHYVYEGVHTPTRPLAPERTVSVHSFSKSYGMAGSRVGYVVGPADLIEHAQRISTHTFYSAPTPSQTAALAALGPAGRAWVQRARERYAELGRAAADRLGVPRPEGSTFLFVDVADSLDDHGLEGLLERAVQRGLLVAPGPSFGPYPTHVRVCFTSAEPDRVRTGFDILAELLGR